MCFHQTWYILCYMEKESIMAESTWRADNVFIPKYFPKNLKWYERDGLDIWYLQNKCIEFLEDTDLHLKQR